MKDEANIVVDFTARRRMEKNLPPPCIACIGARLPESRKDRRDVEMCPRSHLNDNNIRLHTSGQPYHK